MTISRIPTIHGPRYEELAKASQDAARALAVERYREELILDFAEVLKRVVFNEDPNGIVRDAYEVFANDSEITPEMRNVLLKFVSDEN
jgi:hypothetical protein